MMRFAFGLWCAPNGFPLNGSAFADPFSQRRKRSDSEARCALTEQPTTVQMKPAFDERICHWLEHQSGCEEVLCENRDRDMIRQDMLLSPLTPHGRVAGGLVSVVSGFYCFVIVSSRFSNIKATCVHAACTTGWVVAAGGRISVPKQLCGGILIGAIN